jgi:hypothetical protein
MSGCARRHRGRACGRVAAGFGPHPGRPVPDPPAKRRSGIGDGAVGRGASRPPARGSVDPPAKRRGDVGAGAVGRDASRPATHGSVNVVAREGGGGSERGSGARERERTPETWLGDHGGPPCPAGAGRIGTRGDGTTLRVGVRRTLETAPRCRKRGTHILCVVSSWRPRGRRSGHDCRATLGAPSCLPGEHGARGHH